MSVVMKIGPLARASGTNAPTIRYYEQIGLLPAPPRQFGGQRVYGEADLRRLVFIRRCREFGFPINRVRTLAALIQDGRAPCREALELASAHLAEVRAKLAQLHGLETSLAGFTQRCEQHCADGASADCLMLDDLSTPAPAGGGCCGGNPR